MKRTCSWMILAAVVALAATPMLADVKTQQRHSAHLEGILGTFLNRRLGDGSINTLSVKGNRMAIADEKGNVQIIDLTEQNIYIVDTKDKSYKVMTFAEMRKSMEDMAKSLRDQSAGMSQQDKDALADANKQIETSAESKETGQHKTVAGKDTREVIITVTTHERGKRIEESGGFLMMNDLWMADVPALTEVIDFQTRYFKAVFDGVFTGSDLQQTSMLAAMLPGLMRVSQAMAAETAKVRGHALSTTMTFASVKAGTSPEALRAFLAQAAAAQPAQQQQGGGGGLGRLGRMMGAGRASSDNSSGGGVSKLLTTSNEFVSIDNAVNPADLTIPATFKKK